MILEKLRKLLKLDSVQELNPALREELTFLQVKSTALENSLNGFDIVNEEGKFIYVNNAYVSMWGYDSAEEVYKSNPIDHCEDPNIPFKIVSTLKEHGECKIEFKAKRKDGSTFDVLMWARMAKDANGKEIYPTTSIDISDMKSIQKRDKQIIDTIPQGIWRSTADGYNDYCSEKFCQMIGYDIEELLGTGWLKVIYPEDLPKVESAWKSALEAKSAVAIDFRVIHKNGQVRWYHSVGSPFWGKDNNIEYYYGTWSNIHQERLDSLRIEESEAKFRNIATAMPQLIFSATPDGFVDYFNERWYEWLGLPPGSTEGLANWDQKLHEEDKPKAWNAWSTSLKTGAPYEIEYRMLHRSGEYRWILARALPIRNENNVLLRWMGTCTDIHDQKIIEEDLKESVRARDEFLSIASHELKTPLTSLKLQSQLINRSFEKNPEATLKPEKFIQYSTLIDRQIEKVTRLVDDMLDVSRMRAGTVSVVKKEGSLDAVISDVVERITPLFLEKLSPAPVIVSLPEVTACFDRERIEQVLENILNNALRYAKRSQVKVNLEKNESVARITISDQGPGMSPETAKRIFEKFERATNSNEVTGLGLGLYICRIIVDQHGGKISVDSELGKGSSFCIELPLNA